MRISFDRDQFTNSVTHSLNKPCTDAHEKHEMLPIVLPVLHSIMQAVQGTEAPATQQEATARLISALGSAFAVGFDAGRIYEDTEKRNRVEIIQ